MSQRRDRARSAAVGTHLAIKEVANFKQRLYMWNWLNCYLSGNHDFGITCSSGSIYLRCIHCGKRSNGWAVHDDHPALVTVTAPVVRQKVTRGTRALTFVDRDAARQQRSA